MTLKGFTLLELLVVMAIAAVVIGLGLVGMNLFRQTTQFQQAEVAFIADLRAAQNSARNSVSSQVLVDAGNTPIQAQVDGYALFFSNDNYSIHHCFEQVTAFATQYDCGTVEEPDLKAGDFLDIEIRPLDFNKCRGLFFSRLSGNISAMENTLDTLDDVGVCEIRIQHLYNGSLSRVLSIDVSQNSINL